MKCEEYQQNISAMVDDELKDSVMESTKAHLAECEHCQSVLKATRALKKMVSERMHRQAAPVHLRARIRRELDKERRQISAMEQTIPNICV